MKAGWKERTVGDILVLNYGKPLPESMRVADGRYPVFGANGELNRSNSHHCDLPSIIVGRKGSAGALCYVTEPFWPLDVTYYITLKDQTDLRFVWYLLNLLDLPRLARGTKPGINRNEVYELPILIPSKEEQERIVAILDQSFAAIAATVVNAEASIQNARAYFAASLEKHLAKHNALGTEKTLGDIADVQSGGTPPISMKSYWGGSIPWYSSGELNSLETAPSKRFLTEAGVANSNAKLFPIGSLLIGMYDTAALKMSILDRDAAFNQAIAGVKPNDALDLLFVLHSIDANREALLQQRRGTRQRNLSLAKIKSICMKVPPRATQREIVNTLRDDAEVTAKLVKVYEAKLMSLAALKRSFLQQAFSGNL